MPNRYLIFAILLINSTFFSQESLASKEESANKSPSTKMEMLVSTQWLNEHLDDPDLIILDCTFLVKQNDKGKLFIESGKQSYDLEHIPNAGFADLMGVLSDQTSEFDFSMPSPKQFANAMEALGVNTNSRIVLYSHSEISAATRVWWMLRWIGIDKVAILDGGLKAWKAEERALSNSPTSKSEGHISIALRPNIIANQAQVHAAINADQITLMDALPSAHFRGDFAMYPRPGHIPSAINMPSSDLVDGSVYRSYDELDLMFSDERDKPAITYCGGGIAAASLAFTMQRLGFREVAVYMGSLQEWTANPANPMSLEPKSLMQ